jgi:GT2 family glycosyltransferase
VSERAEGSSDERAGERAAVTAVPSPGAPLVRVVVLNYNGDPHLFRCLDALAATDWPEGRLQVVVVDNASADGSADAVAERFGTVELRRLDTNRGFPANNEALRDLGQVDYVGLVNNDAFVEDGWLAPLVATLAEDDTIAAACPKLVFAPRFVELEIHSDTFRAPGDHRSLGVRISGVEVGGVDRWRAAQFPPPGFWGIERGRGEEAHFCWTDGHGVLRVPVEPATPARPGGVAAARPEVPDGMVRVRLAADRRTDVELRSGTSHVRVEVDATPRWFEAAVQGEPFDVVQNAGSILLDGGFGADRGFLERDTGQYDQPADVFAWCGGAVLFRPAYLQDVGLFDERFFAYYEDTDLAWRGRARGWRYRYVPASVVRHQHATTSVEGSVIFNRYVERNRLIMLTKNAPRRLVADAIGRYLLATLSYTRRDVLGRLARGKRPNVGVVGLRLASFGAYLRLLPALLVDRRRLRRRQLVGDRELAAWSQTRR